MIPVLLFCTYLSWVFCAGGREMSIAKGWLYPNQTDNTHTQNFLESRGFFLFTVCIQLITERMLSDLGNWLMPLENCTAGRGTEFLNPVRLLLLYRIEMSWTPFSVASHSQNSTFLASLYLLQGCCIVLDRHFWAQCIRHTYLHSFLRWLEVMVVWHPCRSDRLKLRKRERVWR